MMLFKWLGQGIPDDEEEEAIKKKMGLLMSDCDKLKNALSSISDLKLKNARESSNPVEFYRDDFKISTNRCYIKFAELSHVFGICEQLKEQDKENHVLDICGGPGGFAQFLLDNVSNATVYGITIKGYDNLNYKVTSLKFVNLDNNCGNILHKHVYESVVGAMSNKINFCMADGAINSVEDQEESNFELVVQEINIALECLVEGGNFLLKVFTFVSEKMQNLLLKTSRKFKYVAVCKPLSSRAANSECYFFFEEYTKDGSACCNATVKELSNFMVYALKSQIHHLEYMNMYIETGKCKYSKQAQRESLVRYANLWGIGYLLKN